MEEQPEPEPESEPACTQSVTFLVIGGGIAGVTCAETIATYCPGESVLLLTESNVVKSVVNLQPVARYLYKFDVEERSVTSAEWAGSINVVVDQLKRVSVAGKRAVTRAERVIGYRYLCICTGGVPRLIARDNPRVLGIRDTDSVLELQRRLRHARRIVLVGNGGIASELAHELLNVEVHWVIKDNHIASTFVDPGAGHFLLESTKAPTATEAAAPATTVKRLRYAEFVSPLKQTQSKERQQRGAALGPDWQRNFTLTGGMDQSQSTPPTIHYKANVQGITTTDDDTVKVSLSTGETIECDFVVSATGVEPRHEFTFDTAPQLAADGGILVNDMMETSLPFVYAAGDVCTAGWELAEHWFQMRLWTQARQMGAMAGRSMAAKCAGETIHQDFAFELFGHVTKLFGYQVILLGRYNGQGLGADYEVLLRTTAGAEYVKFVLQHGRLRGAILIGNSDLAETCENLILNSIDLTPFGDDILNPDIDIDDYFD